MRLGKKLRSLKPNLIILTTNIFLITNESTPFTKIKHFPQQLWHVKCSPCRQFSTRKSTTFSLIFLDFTEIHFPWRVRKGRVFHQISKVYTLSFPRRYTKTPLTYTIFGSLVWKRKGIILPLRSLFLIHCTSTWTWWTIYTYSVWTTTTLIKKIVFNNLKK